ncbi:MAG: ATP-binding protein [Geminicoccaceae bacterium]
MSPWRWAIRGTGRLIAIREQTEQVMIEHAPTSSPMPATDRTLASIQGFIQDLRGPAKRDPRARGNFAEISRGGGAHDAPGRRPALALAHRWRRTGARALPAGAGTGAGGAPHGALARAGRVELLAEIAAGLPAITGDPDQLQQLFENLIDNAVKYGSEGKQVTVRARRSRRHRPIADRSPAAPACG